MEHRAALVILALLFACAKQPAAPASEPPKAAAPEPGVPGGIPGGVAVPRPIETAPASEDTTTATPAPTPEQVARVEAIRDREFAVVARDPRYKKEILRAIEGVTDPAVAFERGRVIGEVLSSRGIPRLSDAMLGRWMSVRAQMNHSSEEACAGLSAGQMSQNTLMLAMASLDDDMLADLVHITAAATLAELSAKAPLVEDREGLALGVAALKEQLTPEDRERFVGVLTGTRTSASDHCFASHVLHDRVTRLEPELRARFIRALAVAMASP